MSEYPNIILSTTIVIDDEYHQVSIFSIKRVHVTEYSLHNKKLQLLVMMTGCCCLGGGGDGAGCWTMVVWVGLALG